MSDIIDLSYNPITKKQKALIVRELLDGGITQKELADKYNMSEITVGNWVKKYLTKEERLEIIQKREMQAALERSIVLKELLECKLSRKEIAEKYNISIFTIGNWVKKYLTEEQKELIRKKSIPEKLPERDNLAKIKKYEEQYIRLENGVVDKQNESIKRFYIDTLKIGNGIELDESSAQNEFMKLIEFISTDKFYKQYGREFTIVDMYLTTNLQVKDLFDSKYDFLDKEVSHLLYKFVIDQLQNIDNTFIRDHLNTQKRSLVCRFMRPVDNEMKDIIDCRFFLFKKMPATETDIIRAYETLLDLNQKYGVKYDDVSLYIILREVINENIDSFYELGEKYKKELDIHSHVQQRCIPLLTRREKNR